MQAHPLDSAGQPIPRFAAFLASRIAREFLEAARALIDSSCEAAFSGTPPGHDTELPYWKNVQPHDRNSLVFERLHNLAEDMRMTAKAGELDNTYHYLQIEAGGVVIHVKHRNNYQSLTEQITKAGYRRQLATMNTGFTQQYLALPQYRTKAPDRAYVILFYEDGERKSSVGRIFFVLPDAQDVNNLPQCSIEEVIQAYMPQPEQNVVLADDDIPLPPKNDRDDSKNNNNPENPDDDLKEKTG
jgi:hypothetical protein